MDLVYEPGDEVGLQRPRGRSCSARSWSAWRARTSTPSRARAIFEPLGMKDTTFRPGPELAPAHRAHRERPLARPRPARRGARRERVRPRRRRCPRRPLRHRPRPRPLRADAARTAASSSTSASSRARRSSGSPSARACPDSSRAPGLGHARATNSSAGTCSRPRSFGHTGFTGTSMWIDPERKLFVILLTNRVHPTRENNADPPGPPRRGRRGGAGAGPAMNSRAARGRPCWPPPSSRSGAAAETPGTRWRRAATPAGKATAQARSRGHGRAVTSRSASSRSRPTKGGPLKGKKVGLIAHAASVTADGRRAVDVLRAAGVDVVRLFAPEHGVRGQAAAGEKVGDSGSDPHAAPRRQPLRREDEADAGGPEGPRRPRLRPAGRRRALLHVREHDDARPARRPPTPASSSWSSTGRTLWAASASKARRATRATASRRAS